MTEITTPNRVWLVEVVPYEDGWNVVLHYKNNDLPPKILNHHETKAPAEAEARRVGREIAQAQGNPVEARFKLRNGQIPKGVHGTATYGHDPKETSG